MSICMATHNRKRQLLNTLRSINHTKQDYNIEVIIVDDNSDEKLTSAELSKFDYPINYIIRKDRTRQDPVIPNNIAFNEARGDIVMMSCGEVMLAGNIIDHAFKNCNDTNYLCYGVYAIDQTTYGDINTLDWKKPEVITKIKSIVDEVSKAYYMPGVANGWYIHTKYRPHALPFCAVLTKKNMDILSGYDERFQFGVGSADVDFVRRINDLKLQTIIIDDPLAVHQPHEMTDYSNGELFQLNLDLLNELTATHNIKADHNIVYIR